MSTFSVSQITTHDELLQIGIRDPGSGLEHLNSILHAGIPVELFRTFIGDLRIQLALVPDSDMSLEHLANFVSISRNPLSLMSLVERDKGAFAALLHLFGSSIQLSQWLIDDPEAFDLIRMTDGQPVERNTLLEDVVSEVIALKDRRSQQRAILRHKKRELLRIAYGQILRQQDLTVVTEQISQLADVLCEAALAAIVQTLQAKHGVPRNPNGTATRVVLVGLGRWGGLELNYAGKLRPVFFYEHEGRSDGPKSISNVDYITRCATEFEKLLTSEVDGQTIYKFEPTGRPMGQSGPLVWSVDRALNYYVNQGRTWERQLFIKARCISGDTDLGSEFLSQMNRWVYRRYLSRADFTELKALKRRIEHRYQHLDKDDTNFANDHSGGIIDIEFAMQFLQLLNGAKLESVQTSNTLEAIEKLAETDCIAASERDTLIEGFSFLKQIHLYLQILFDSSNNVVPADPIKLRVLARCMLFNDSKDGTAVELFLDEVKAVSNANRGVLNRLLQDAFSDDRDAHPAIDLILDPAPSAATIQNTLLPYGFKNPLAAYEFLVGLANEQIPFLSTRRCRHFLSAIAPTLFRSLGKTPDPDATLSKLVSVSDSLGGKGVLWELFSFNRPTLDLYVRLCAGSSYLSSILTSNPGMLDELMDSLVRNRLPTRASLEETLTELERGSEPVETILHQFKNAQHLTVGVRDLLGKEDIQTTTRFLADVAELCLQRVVSFEFEKLKEKYGVPYDATGISPVTPIVLSMGKLAGQEPNYHSNFDLIFLYRSEGTTNSKSKSTSNQHFFHELAQRTIKRAKSAGSRGMLYDVDIDPSIRVESGRLAISLDEFESFFPANEIKKPLSLCKARPIYGETTDQQAASDLVKKIICESRLDADGIAQVVQLRKQLEHNASPNNLKRAPGGTLDIEFIVQALQLCHGHDCNEILTPGTIDGLNGLQKAGLLDESVTESLIDAYRYLRSVEARIRLMNTTALHDLPSQTEPLRKLAYLLNTTDDKLNAEFQTRLRETREIFASVLKS